jgi:hypothetical protein
MPYLAHVKSLSRFQTTLRHLADFMEVGTTPLQWRYLRQSAAQEERKERVSRTNVAYIEYRPQTAPQNIAIASATQLKEILSHLKHDPTRAPPMRLFLVEDLSRDVIELLGSRFDVDPLFFREHIEDYVWFNIHEPAAIPSSLMSSMKQRSWFRLRNMRLRFHKTKSSFESAKVETNTWNVRRRPDDDQNNWSYKDPRGSVVSLLRTRTTIWVGKDKYCGGGTVGIILLDPTIRSGKPLWYDRTNWLPTTSMEADPPPFRFSKSWFEDIVQMTVLYPWYEAASGHRIDPSALTCPTLYTSCAEWLVMCDYINGRLSQIEWELEMPAIFRPKDSMIDSLLKRLATWRRQIPVMREMVTEALEQSLPAAERLAQSQKEVENIRPDFERVLRLLKELQNRVDLLTGYVNSAISIEDTKQSLSEGHGVARLSWLAMIFVPLTFITGLFSMTDDLASLEKTYRVYFPIAIPLTVAIMLFALFLSSEMWKDMKAAIGRLRRKRWEEKELSKRNPKKLPRRSAILR